MSNWFLHIYIYIYIFSSCALVWQIIEWFHPEQWLSELQPCVCLYVYLPIFKYFHCIHCYLTQQFKITLFIWDKLWHLLSIYSGGAKHVFCMYSRQTDLQKGPTFWRMDNFGIRNFRKKTRTLATTMNFLWKSNQISTLCC